MKTENQIKSVEQLKKIASKDGGEDFFILLGGGAIRSSKHIDYYPKDDTFWILNEVDGSDQTLKTKSLKRYTNIIEAIEKNSLFQYI